MEQQRQKVLGAVIISGEAAEDLKKNVKNVADLGKKITDYAEQNITNLSDVILMGAVRLNVSDIHIEPQKEQARLRMRIDGLLQDIIPLALPTYRNLLSRLKLLSKIKINVTDKPQDGRFTITAENLPIDIRTSSLPSEYGESVVMRVLNPKNLKNLNTLGLRKDLLELFEEEIKKPGGMIAVTGPTGAGKTTTLYAFLLEIKKPSVEIITIEDPIEYHVEGILQTQVAPQKGYDFSDGLRSIVRQDPDVILVGEIRDAETATIALQAALTGHLVLTTLHTGSAVGAIPRLIDLGSNPSTIAPALKMAVAQRLIRLVCKKCAVFEKPSSKELAEIKKELSAVVKKLEIKQDLDKVKIARAKKDGCPDCNLTGYKGRKGVFEAFLVNEQTQDLILKNPSFPAIKSHLAKRGMITMYQAGLIEVILGETTLQEVKKNIES